MAAVTDTSLECLDASGNGVRVEFWKQEDRFAHTIFGVSGGKTVPWLTSIEGTPDEFSPPSPPFAELHQQDDILFLSGATTLGHWSMCVQPVEGRLLFDVACRLKGEASSLGSSYQSLAANVAIEPEDGDLREREEDTLMIVPSTQTAITTPRTIQWRYSIAGDAFANA